MTQGVGLEWGFLVKNLLLVDGTTEQMLYRKRLPFESYVIEDDGNQLILYYPDFLFDEFLLRMTGNRPTW